MKKINEGIVVYICIFLGVVCMLWISICYPGENIGFNSEEAAPYNNGWYYFHGDQTTYITLPASIQTKAGEDYTIYNYFPRTLVDGASMCFFTSSQQAIVECEGVVLYERGIYSSNYISNAMGNWFNTFRIPEKYAGKLFSITFNSYYQVYSGVVYEITYGSKSANLFYLLEKNSLILLISIFVFFVGILLIFFHFFLFGKDLQNKGLIYIGMFAMLLSLWLLAESRIMQFLSGSQALNSYLSYIAAMIFPIFIIQYYISTYTSRIQCILRFLFWCFFFNFIVSVVAQVFRIADFFQMIPITHFLIVLTSIVIVISLTVEVVKYRNVRAGKVFLPVFILSGSSVIEVIGYYYQHVSILKYVSAGFVLFVILIAADALRKMRTMSETYQESKYFEKMAYHDFLTGGKNRAAFYKEIFGIYQKKEFEGLWLVLLDINGLKEINDQFGHLEGDKAILHAFRSIEKTVGKLGESYRIGGDEFACIIKNENGKNLEREVEMLQKEAVKTVMGFEYEFTIAYGYDSYHKETDAVFDTFYKRVDQYMYRKKTAMKMVSN